MVSSLRKNLGPEPFLDCHLMISNPEKWVDDYSKGIFRSKLYSSTYTIILAGASQFVFHLEAVNNDVEKAVELVQRVGDANMLAGVAIKPGTPVDGLLAVMDRCSELKTKSEFFPKSFFSIFSNLPQLYTISF